jgi:isoprenylcysteine carboxyl methyltransferase (ICMT) family protein YpbQ
MSSAIIFVLIIAAIIRLSALAYSIKNEKKLKQAGAVEYGKLNSTAMAIIHTLFYLACFAEAYLRKARVDNTTVIGIVIYVFSIAVLGVVMRQLGGLWTVKLLIAKEHPINNSFIFRYFRHPNYYLNIIPELISLALICKAQSVFTFLFPLYLITMIIRVVQEDKIMKENFAHY